VLVCLGWELERKYVSMNIQKFNVMYWSCFVIYKTTRTMLLNPEIAQRMTESLDLLLATVPRFASLFGLLARGICQHLYLV